MASQQPDPSHQAHSGKVAVLSSGNLHFHPGSDATASASASEAAEGKNIRRKVGTTYERSFAEPPRLQPQVAAVSTSGSRPMLKAGKAVSSAPPAPLRPMTELEEDFAKRPPADQRWLLSFPLAMKQVYFSFAESPNHDLILSSLISRFPDLLAGIGQNPPAIQLAIERGNWLPATKFVAACTGNQHIDLLRYRCGVERRTYPMLAIDHIILHQPAEALDQWLAAGRHVIAALFSACPDLVTAADAGARNPLHRLAELCPTDQPPAQWALAREILQDLRTACGASPELSGRLGDALAARDCTGQQPTEVAAASAACREALELLQLEFPPSGDQPMAEMDPECRGEKVRDQIRAALDERAKSDEFVKGIRGHLSSHPMSMVLQTLSASEAVQNSLDWFKESNRAELKQVLVDIGQSDLCHLVDRL